MKKLISCILALSALSTTVFAELNKPRREISKACSFRPNGLMSVFDTSMCVTVAIASVLPMSTSAIMSGATDKLMIINQARSEAIKLAQLQPGVDASPILENQNLLEALTIIEMEKPGLSLKDAALAIARYPKQTQQ